MPRVAVAMWTCGGVWLVADAARGSWLQQFGDIDYVKILTDRESGKSKGLAFVKYDRSYHAALALEQCDARESWGWGVLVWKQNIIFPLKLLPFRLQA